MICAGDEMGRTQRGNNNAYVQDNAVSWIDWDLDEPRLALLSFVQRLAAIRRAHPSFRRRAFLKGEPIGPTAMKDATWIRPLRDAEEGEEPVPGNDMLEMSVADWEKPALAALGLLLSGEGLGGNDPFGPPVRDDTFLLLFNAEPTPARFRVPRLPSQAHPEPGKTVEGSRWTVLVDTADEAPAAVQTGEARAATEKVEARAPSEKTVAANETLVLAGRSFVLLASRALVSSPSLGDRSPP